MGGCSVIAMLMLVATIVFVVFWGFFIGGVVSAVKQRRREREH